LMARQHRHIDVGVQGVVDGNGRHAALAESLHLLYLHIYLEEEFLFPPLERFGITMPVFVMKKEHAEMWPYMQCLHTGCERQTALAALHDPALALFRLLQVHNPKEEEVVYTAADRLAAENPDALWLAALHNEIVPAGWRCAMRSAVEM